MESAHNSASHTSQLCPVASLQPWALETQKYTGGGYELLEKSIILLLCFPRLFITAKKNLSCVAGRRSCSGCCFGAEYPSPCGGAMWSMGQNMVLQHSKVLLAESKKSARGSLCTPLRLWFSAGLRYLLQDPLHQISIHNLTLKNQSGISVFPSKTQSVCLANNKALRDLIQKGFFLRASMSVTDWRDADLHLRLQSCTIPLGWDISHYLLFRGGGIHLKMQLWTLLKILPY